MEPEVLCFELQICHLVIGFEQSNQCICAPISSSVNGLNNIYQGFIP